MWQKRTKEDHALRHSLPLSGIFPVILISAEVLCYPYFRYSEIAIAAFLPAPMALMTVLGPVTVSPPA